MSIQEPTDGHQLPALHHHLTDGSVFSLEMGPDGVHLRLCGVGLQDWLLVSDLVLSVPHVPRSFDYSAGPRSLQSELTRLERVVIEIKVDRLFERLRVSRGMEVSGMRILADQIVVSGQTEGSPFTLRLHPKAPMSGQDQGDIEVQFDDPHVFGWVSRSWDRLGEILSLAIPNEVRASSNRTSVRLNVLRPVLMPLLCGMGCKIPVMEGVGVSAIRFDSGRLVLEFEAGVVSERSIVLESTKNLPEIPVDPEGEARTALAVLAGNGDPIAAARLLTCGVVVPRLWPEVLIAARNLGEERPEWVLPHLVGLLLATRMPEIVSSADIVQLARRLLAAVESSESSADLFHAGRLIATVSFDLSPDEALSLMDGVRSRGVSEPVVLEAAALALDRLGRTAEARAVRARLLALAPTGRIPEVLGAVVDRLDRAGLNAVATSWLDDTLARSEEGRFGSEGPVVHRLAMLLRATREILAGDPNGRVRLQSLLRLNPSDREALDLLLLAARSDREVAEAVVSFRDAADSVSGSERASLLRDAARATSDRLGLKRQSVSLLEDALSADPRDMESVDALDRLCTDLGMNDRRLVLARTRLAMASGLEARAQAQLRVAGLAELVGDINEAAACISGILACDPTNREALEAGIRVFAGCGDDASLRGAWETLLDLDARHS